jgi:NAD-dependent dihydropyrimidine dehydrogenase PreA subunit
MSIEIPDGAKDGPIDIAFKSKMKPSTSYAAPNHTIKTWGRKGTNNGIMGIWGEFVSVDYDICVGDGGCIDACPVDVYEWFDTPGNPGSKRKPLMYNEPDCIFCLACENVCPPQAIKIFEQK